MKYYMYIWRMFKSQHITALLQIELDRLSELSSESRFVVEEPEAPYNLTIDSILNKKMTLISMIQNGISSEFLFSLIDASPFSLTDWCSVTNIPYRTMLRYQKEPTIIKSIYTEKVFAFAEVIQLGLEVFGSEDKLQLWLYNKKFVFNDQRPIDLLQSSYGKDIVLTALHHIEHGIFA